jgi:FAD/FMN-containing dehydrogenase
LSNSNPTMSNRISRRLFLARGLAAAGTIFVPTAATAERLITLNKSAPDFETLKTKFGFKGAVVTPTDAKFKEFAYGGLWNKLAPKRAPQAIARVKDEQDVIAAVKFARANKLKVCVRGGGHNWCAPSLRNSGVMIDLSDLNKVISIDAENRRAVVQPIISNREMIAALKPYNLAYPTGHCPPVKLSGYLLSGGMSWNHGVWGPGVGSVEAIELINPQGELITADASQNTDYYWAARGAGPGFFGVALRYHLKLYPLPKAIHWSSYYYPYEDLIAVAEWLGPLAKQLPSSIELSLFVLTAPPDLAEKCKSSNGKVAMVTATMFADTPEEAKTALRALDGCPILDKCLKKSVAEPTNFEMLFDASGALWPGNLRNNVDALFSNANVADLFKRVQEHALKCPSPKSVLMFAIYTGPDVPVPTPKDAAFSMTAKNYGGPWTMWDTSAEDAANIAWHAKCVDLLKPLISGHYVSESDTVTHPEYAKAGYSRANWERLGELRKRHDPDGVFFAYSDGLSANGAHEA